MGQFDQFANQGGAAAWDPDEAAEAKRVAEEQLRTADYAGDLPEPLGSVAAESTDVSVSDDAAQLADGNGSSGADEHTE